MILFLLFTSALQAAEVYVWTDAQGRTQFSDKPPETQGDSAEEVSKERYELENIDSGYPYADPDLYRDQSESYLERKQRETAERDQSKQQYAAAMAKACAKARRRLSMMQGRVNFVDDAGNVIATTEAERLSEEKALRKEINARCR